MDRISTGGELTNELGSSSVDEGNNGVVPRPARHGIGPVASSRRSSHTYRDATMSFGWLHRTKGSNTAERHV